MTRRTALILAAVSAAFLAAGLAVCWLLAYAEEPSSPRPYRGKTSVRRGR